MNDGSHCGACFPDRDELARLADNAQAGRAEPFVGAGHPDTMLACAHGQWRLADALAEPDPEPRACAATTKAGEPCRGTPGDDGYCAAHKSQKGDGDGAAGDLPPVVVDGDPPQEAGQAQESGQEAGPQDHDGQEGQ